MRSWSYQLAFLTFLAFSLLAGRGAAEQSAFRKAMESITAAELKEHVDRLADDTFEGREAGSRGGNAAAGYIVDRLRRFELAPAGIGGAYFQPFDGGYRNILALIEGSDPQLKQEVIVVGAHFDHVGYGSQRNSYGPWGYIHNGADDNASGTAGLLEIAAAFKEAAFQPKRSILLAFWDAEEKGLLGSTHWANSPTMDFSRVKCLINADMIGRLTNNRVEVYGSRSAPGFRRLVSEANREAALDLDFTWTMKDDSDHWPFFQRNVPILMFHTGMHKEYHRPSDDAHLINQQGIERVSRLMFTTIVNLAMQETLPTFRSAGRRETVDVQRLQERAVAGPPPRLGLTWNKRSTEAGLELVVAQVNYPSAAQRAGIVSGDIITHLNQEPITNDEQFRRQILLAENQVEFRVLRQNQPPREVKVQLNGQPVRIGISWREDPAEPGVVIVSHVVYGSAAHRAKIQNVDRIIAVNGQPFPNAAAFAELLHKSPEQLEFRCERRGQIFEAPLEFEGEN